MRTIGAILVVDSDGAIAGIITEILCDEGYTVAVAHDRAATPASVAHQLPALVLLDDQAAGLTTPRLLAHITHQHLVSVPLIPLPLVHNQATFSALLKPVRCGRADHRNRVAFPPAPDRFPKSRRSVEQLRY